MRESLLRMTGGSIDRGCRALGAIRAAEIGIAAASSLVVLFASEAVHGKDFSVSRVSDFVFSQHSLFEDFRVRPDALYFVASSQNGKEVFRANGDSLVEIDINPGPDSSYPHLNIFRGLDDLFLIRARGTIGQELFSVDDRGALIEFDLVPGPAGSSIANWAQIGDQVLMAVERPDGIVLYETDGIILTELETMPTSRETLSFVGRGTGFDGALVFEAIGPDGFHMYRTDGVVLEQLDENDPLREIATGSIGFGQVDGGLVFRTGTLGRQSYYITDGVSVSLIPSTEAGAVVSNPRRAKNLGNRMFFAGTGTNGQELFMTDGFVTIEYDFEPGPTSSFAGERSPFVELNGELLTTAVGANGDEVFITNAATFVELDVNPGPMGSFAERFKETPGRVFFSAEGLHGRELFVTDGDTLTEFDLNDGTADSMPSVDDAAVLGDGLALSAEGTNGRELFITDGTGFREFDLNPGAASSNPRSMIEFAGQVVFTATGPDGEAIFRTDGNVVEEMMAINRDNGRYARVKFAEFQNELFFLEDTSSGVHLFKISVVPEPATATLVMIAIVCGSAVMRFQKGSRSLPANCTATTWRGITTWSS